MKKRMEEKKRTIEVLEAILNGMEWTVKNWRSNVEEYEKAMKENPEEVRDWEKTQAEAGRAYLETWEQVKKHLEKLL